MGIFQGVRESRRVVLPQPPTAKDVADLRGLERMSPEDAAQKILSEMAKGRNFGDAVTGGRGTRQMSLVGKRKDGIEVYESDADVRKLPFNERVKRFVDLMRNEYAGRTARFTKDGETYYATFDKGEIDKNAYGDNQSDAAGRDAKINAGASGDIFDLVEDARYDHSTPESGKPGKMHKDVKSWDYFDKTVQIDGKVFDVLVNVRDKGDNQFVYNVALRANNKLRANGRLLDHEGLASGAVDSTRNSISNPSAESQGGAENLSPVRESRRVVPPPPTPPALRGRNGTPPGPRIDVDRKETNAEYVQRKMQDYRAPIKRLEEQIGLSDKSKSLYYSLDRVYGKNRDQSHRLAKTTVEPIVEKIHKSGGEVTDGTRLAALAPTFADVFAVAKHRLEKSHWTMSIISRRR